MLGTSAEQIARLPRVALADSALATPRAGFAEQDAYPGLIEKAAVLVDLWPATIRCPMAISTLPSCLCGYLCEDGRPSFEEDPDIDVAMVERISVGEASP